jgi:hypothetical protein
LQKVVEEREISYEEARSKGIIEQYKRFGEGSTMDAYKISRATVDLFPN